LVALNRFFMDVVSWGREGGRLSFTAIDLNPCVKGSQREDEKIGRSSGEGGGISAGRLGTEVARTKLGAVSFPSKRGGGGKAWGPRKM